jgi:hypothetical protein
MYERHKSDIDDLDPGASSPDFVREENAFLERKKVDQFLLPHHVQWLVADRLLYEWRIEEIRINHTIDPNLFRPRR